MSNLRLINETTVSSNTVSTINITDVFSSDYDVYKIVSTAHIHSAAKDIYIRYINSSGSVVSDSDYHTATLMLRAASSVLERPSDKDDIDTGTFFTLTSGDEGGGAVEYVFNPTSTSSYTYGMNEAQGFLSGTGAYGAKTIRMLEATTSITGFNLYNGESSDNFGGGTINVYGLRVDT